MLIFYNIYASVILMKYKIRVILSYLCFFKSCCGYNTVIKFTKRTQHA